MMLLKKARVVSMAGLLTGVAISGAGAYAQEPGKSRILEKIIVKVNGEILTQSQLELAQIQEIRDRNQEGRPMSEAEVQKAMAELTPKLLLDEVDNLLLVQHAREVGLKYSDELFKAHIENVKKQNPGIKTDQQFAEALKEAGMTLEQLRLNFEKSYLIQGVQQREIMRNMQLTEEEARQYYKAHTDEFMKPPAVTVRDILVAVPTENVAGQASVNVAADEAAKKKIDSIRARALAGEDFVKLVAEASESGTKANGGLLGPIVVGDLNPAFAAAIEKLKPGEISEPVRLRGGYQIFKLESRSSSEAQPFADVRNEIAQKIYEARLDVEQAKFLDKLRVQALIEWKDDSYKKMYEQAAASRTKRSIGPQAGASPRQ